MDLQQGKRIEIMGINTDEKGEIVSYNSVLYDDFCSWRVIMPRSYMLTHYRMDLIRYYQSLL